MRTVIRLERVNREHPDGPTIFFVERGSRKNRSRFYDPSVVPEFEGWVGFFEVERKGKAVTFIRQVNGP